MNNSILLRTLCRFLKECEVYGIFAKYLSKRPLKTFLPHYLNYSQNYIYFLYTLLPFKVKPPIQSVAVEVNRDFNRVIFVLCKSQIIKYIEEHNLINKINANIAYVNKYSLNLYDNFDNYLIYAFENGISPLRIISQLFQWNCSKEGYHYWSEIDNNFRFYMLHYLTVDCN